MSDLELSHLESLWRSYKVRLHHSPDLSISVFAAEHPESQKEILRLFPMMKDLGEFARDPIGHPEYIDGYKIVRPIGLGGMGVVYEATTDSIRERVAIKVVDPNFLADRSTERFEQEARLVAALHHSNIVPVYDFGEFEGNKYYTMRFIDGPNLSEVLHRTRHDSESELSTKEVRAIEIGHTLAGNWKLQAESIRQVASAIAYAHSAGVLHRDVKPANLLVDSDFKFWVTDFGLAKLCSDDHRMTLHSKVMGTPRYMAPEQIRGEADKRSDIFGLGLVLYEMMLLTRTGENGRHPIWKGGLRPPSEQNPEVPAELEAIVMKAVSLDPDARHATTNEFIADLDRFLGRSIANSRKRLDVTTTTDSWSQSTGGSDNDLVGRRGGWKAIVLGLLGLFLVLLTGQFAVNQFAGVGVFASHDSGSGTNDSPRQTQNEPPVLPTAGNIDDGRSDGNAKLLVAEGTKIVEGFSDTAMLSRQSSFQMRGVDQESFLFNSGNRELSFRNPPDFEIPRDANGDNTYEVEFVEDGGSRQIRKAGIVVTDVNEPPRFSGEIFKDGSQTIEIDRRNFASPMSLNVDDDRDSVYDGIHFSVVGGLDQESVAMTPSGVFSFLEAKQPASRSGKNVFEFEVAASDGTRSFFLHLYKSKNGKLSLSKCRIGTGGKLVTDSNLDFSVRQDIVDIATADGQRIFHIHKNEEGTLALYQSMLNAAIEQTRLLNRNCGLPQGTIALATADAENFMIAVRSNETGMVTLSKARLDSNGVFTMTLLNDRCRSLPDLAGLSWLDENRFQHIRSTNNGSRFYFSFLKNSNFVNMPLSHEPSHFDETVVGQAAWVERSSDSITTVRPFQIRIVDSN